MGGRVGIEAGRIDGVNAGAIAGVEVGFTEVGLDSDLDFAGVFEFPKTSGVADDFGRQGGNGGAGEVARMDEAGVVVARFRGVGVVGVFRGGGLRIGN